MDSRQTCQEVSAAITGTAQLFPCFQTFTHALQCEARAAGTALRGCATGLNLLGLPCRLPKVVVSAMANSETNIGGLCPVLEQSA